MYFFRLLVFCFLNLSKSIYNLISIQMQSTACTFLSSPVYYFLHISWWLDFKNSPIPLLLKREDACIYGNKNQIAIHLFLRQASYLFIAIFFSNKNPYFNDPFLCTRGLFVGIIWLYNSINYIEFKNYILMLIVLERGQCYAYWQEVKHGKK